MSGGLGAKATLIEWRGGRGPDDGGCIGNSSDAAHCGVGARFLLVLSRVVRAYEEGLHSMAVNRGGGRGR